MKILYHHRTNAEDGQAVHIRALIEAFRAEGHEVREVALVTRSTVAPVPVPVPAPAPAPVPVPAPAPAPKKSRWSWIGSVPGFVRELAEYAYTVPARRRLVRAGREWRPDFIYERYAFGNAAGVQAAERLGIPLILEVNSPMVLELSKTRGLTFPGLGRRVETSIFRRASRVCVVTQVLGDMLVDLGVERERIFVTPNGVHTELYEGADRERARSELGLEGTSGPVLGFVGYYRDWHRLDLVLRGMTRPELSRAHLVLIGEGPVEEELGSLANELGMRERLHFAGTRAHAAIPGLLSAFDVALVPAINPYASPLKLHEYMAAGLAIIAPDQPNLREVLSDDENALLVPAGDGEALCEALVRLLGDEDLRARLGAQACRTIVERDLTWRGNARRVIQVVEECQ